MEKIEKYEALIPTIDPERGDAFSGNIARYDYLSGIAYESADFEISEYAAKQKSLAIWGK